MGSHSKTRFPFSWMIHQRRCDVIQSGSLTKIMGLVLGVTTQDILVTKELG